MSTRKDETRARLFRAARQLLLKDGFNQVTLEDIAEAAGVSRQAVYKSHFASKAELLLELVRYLHEAEKLDELTAPYFAAGSGLEMLREGVRCIVRIEGRIHDVALALSAAALSDPGAAAALRDREQVKRGAIQAALERVKGDGDFAGDWSLDEALDVLTALLSIDTYQSLVVVQGWPPERLIQRICELSGRFLRGRGLEATPDAPRAPAPRRRRSGTDER